MKLNLGCGRDIKKGYINLDIVDLPGVDVVCNIEKKLPFDDSYFDEIYCDNVLEHVNNLDYVLGEIHRILKNNGVVKIKVPHFSSFCSFTDPTHKRFFGYFTLDYYTNEGIYNFYNNLRFNITKRNLSWFWFKKRKGRDVFISLFMSSFPLFYERFLCWIFPASEIYFELKPIKED
jgi:predicted SAM-dependent methyltransferase